MKTLAELTPSMFPVYDRMSQGREWIEVSLFLKGGGGAGEPLEVN